MSLAHTVRLDATPYTFAGLRELLASLPAERRAQLVWAQPAMDRLLARLFEEPLEQALLREVIEELLRCSTSIRSAAGDLLRRPGAKEALIASLLDELPAVEGFLGGGAIGAQYRFGVRMIVWFLRHTEPPEAGDAPEQADLEAALRRPEGTCFFVGFTLLLAVLDAAGRHHHRPMPRCQDLVRVAFDATIQLARIHRPDLDDADLALLTQDAPQDADASRWLVSLSALRPDPHAALQPLVYPWPLDVAALLRTPPPAPPRVRRIEGHIQGISLWGESGQIQFRSGGGIISASASPEQLAQALACRVEPVEALVLDRGNGLTVLRIALATEPAPDLGSLRESMLHDWDELLHRLAR